jgi:hypothetical protein
MGFMRHKKRFVCANCGFEGAVAMKGVNPLLWVVVGAIFWNAWLFHHVGMELQALLACLFALLTAWIVLKLPRWIQCPLCGWKHPVGKEDRDTLG